MVDTAIRFRCPRCDKQLKPDRKPVAGGEMYGCHQPVLVPEYATPSGAGRSPRSAAVACHAITKSGTGRR